jgi:excisionase family DNA binding protein
MADRSTEDFGEVMTLDDVAKLLSYKVETVQAMVRRGDIPAYRLPNSRRWFVKKSRLLETLFDEKHSNTPPGARP